MNEDSYRISGVPCTELASKVGTPIFIYDEEKIETRIREYKQYFVSPCFETKILYASKAFLCGALVRLLNKEGFCLDVVSGGELYCARTNDFPSENIYFHGNNKSDEEIALALEFRVGGIILDSEMECSRILELSKALKRNIDVMIRINPGIEAHTHKYIMTADSDSKFGVSINDFDAVANMIQKIQKSGHATFKGFHAHIGSQIFELSAFKTEIEVLMDFVEKVETTLGIPVEALDLGGGFAAYYTEEDQPIPTEEVCRAIIDSCESEVMRRKLHLKTLMIEPGRSIVAEAGYTLYRAGFLKNTANKSYVFVDGGMSDNIRPALYQAKYNCDNISRLGEPRTHKMCVAGKCCESGDILIEEIMMPETKTGDLILMYTTGAYGYSMASNYNKIGRPPVVFAYKGKARLVVKRESYEDLIALDCDKNVL